MAWVAGPSAALAWEAPALDPRLLKAVFLTFVELALVTAIALFFSTFSTPLLSAAFTFGLFVAGRFSADLRNFNQVVESPAAAWLAQALYWVLPNLAPFDVRSQVVHAQPVTLRVPGDDDRLRGPVRGGAPRRSHRSSSRAATSNDHGGVLVSRVLHGGRQLVAAVAHARRPRPAFRRSASGASRRTRARKTRSTSRPAPPSVV